MTERKISLLPLLLVPFIITCAVTFFYGRSLLLGPVDSDDSTPQSFIVESGDNWTSLTEKLKAADLIKSTYSIWLLTKVNENVKDQGLQPGEYELRKSYSPRRILNAFIFKEIIFHDVLIKEGYNIYDVANAMARTGIVSYADAEKAIASVDLMTRFDIEGDTLEGYLQPAKYSYTRPITAEGMVEKMLKNNLKNRTDAMYLRASALGLNFSQAVVLASIVQREAGNIDEMPTIASVFINRINRGMRLQSDPTTVYHIANFKGKVTKKHLQTDSPWNTYLRNGLPPSPISNPGTDALLAVLDPAYTDYLYFVARGDGTHYFSHTYGQHKKAINYYLKKKGDEPPFVPARAERTES